MNTIKKIVAACLIGAVAFSLNAQPDPGATVDPVTGELVLTDGTRISPPAGEIVDGNLVVDGNTIVAPDATPQPDGSLLLGDGTTLEVPDLPGGGDFIVSWFGSDFYDYDGAIPADQNQTYFSFTLKNMFHFAASNWFYMQEFDATMFFDPNSGNRSLSEGVWAYSNNLFPGQTSGIWVFISGANGFNDLRDSDGDGVNDLDDGAAGGQVLEGVLYLSDSSGYDANGAGFFYFSEFDSSATDPGNFIIRLTPSAGAWVELTNPVE